MLTAKIDLMQPHPTPLLMDNESVLALAKDPHFHTHAKHINTQCHYIRECIDNSDIYLSYVSMDDNITNILTKPLATPNFLCLRSFLRLYDLP
jgi:hypothetical protein